MERIFKICVEREVFQKEGNFVADLLILTQHFFLQRFQKNDFSQFSTTDTSRQNLEISQHAKLQCGGVRLMEKENTLWDTGGANQL